MKRKLAPTVEPRAKKRGAGDDDVMCQILEERIVCTEYMWKILGKWDHEELEGRNSEEEVYKYRREKYLEVGAQ